MCVCVCVCVDACVYIYIYVCVCVCVCVSADVIQQTHAPYSAMPFNTRTHMHAHSSMRTCFSCSAGLTGLKNWPVGVRLLLVCAAICRDSASCPCTHTDNQVGVGVRDYGVKLWASCHVVLHEV